MHNIYCSFERVILSTKASCEMAQSYTIAERVGVACRAWDASHRCARLLQLLRENTAFALKTTGTETELPYGKELKMRIGGLLGVQAVAFPEREGAQQIDNIYAVVARAEEEFGALDQLPYSRIVRSVTAFKTRRRGNRVP